MTSRDRLLACLVVVLWGINFLFIELGVRDWPPLLLVAARFVVVALPLVFIVPRPTAPWHRVAAVGLLMSAGQFGLLYTAMHFGMTPGLASIVLQAQAVFTVLFSLLFLGERPTVRVLVGTGIGCAGLLAIALGLSSGVPYLGLLLTVAAAASWGAGNVVARSVRAGGLSLTVWSGLVVPIPLFAASLVLDGPAVVGEALLNPTLGVLASTAYTAGCASLIGYGLWNGLLSRHRASEVAPYSLLVPLVAVLAAWLVLGDIPTPSELAGGALLLLGVAVTSGVLRLRRRKRDRGTSAAEAEAQAGAAAGTDTEPDTGTADDTRERRRRPLCEEEPPGRRDACQVQAP